MNIAVWMWRRVLALALVSLVSACGGGGGGDGDVRASPPEGNPGFAISGTSVALAVERGQSPLPSETIAVSINSPQVAGVAAGYRVGTPQPGWLQVGLVSTGGSTYALQLTPSPLLPASGTYSTTLTIGSANADGDILGSYDINVTLAVSEVTTVASPTLAFTVIHGAPNPSPLTLSMTMPSSRSWQAQGSADWLQVTPASGTGSGTVAVAVNAAAMGPGDYAGRVSIVANGRTQTRPVTLTIRPAILVAEPAAVDVALLTGGALPASTPLQINFSNGGATNWTLVSKPDWVTLDKTSGTTPDVMRAAVDVPRTAPTTRSGEIVLSGSTGVQLRIPVAAAVTGPVINLGASFMGFNGVNGSVLATQNLNIALSDGGAATWTVSPSVNWLRVVSTSGSTTSQVQVSVDADTPALASGTYTTQLPISVSWSGRTLSTSIPVTLTLTRPSFSLSSTNVTLGGANGRDFSAGNVTVSLNTGARTYPVSVTGAPVWLLPALSAASVGATPASLSLPLNEMPASPGANSAGLTLATQVNGDSVTASLAVTFNRDTQRLLASDNGVALTSTPGWSRLTRTVQMQDNFNRIGTWTATADQPWLQVTPTGSLRAGDLTLTANPAGLTADRLYTGTVTVTSNDGNRATDLIQVGLWVGASTPSAVTSVAPVTARAWKQVVPDPVRPYAYVHDGGTDVLVYNIYTGALVASIANVGTVLGPMAVASDGGALYVIDATAQRIVPVNLVTRAVGATFTDATGSQAAQYNLAYGRVNGTGVLGLTWTAWLAVDGVTRVKSIPFTGGGNFSFSRDGRTLLSIDQGLSPATVNRYAVDYSTLANGTFIARATGTLRDVTRLGSNGADISASADGSVIYTAAGAPYNFPRFSGTPLAYVGAFTGDAYPVSVKVASDGRIFAAASVSYGPTDVWVYTPGGTLVTSAYVSGYARSVLRRQFWPSGDALMGIALTDDPVMKFIPVGP